MVVSLSRFVANVTSIKNSLQVAAFVCILRLILIANDSNMDYGGITYQQEIYTNFNEICGTSYGLEKQFSYESYGT